MGEVRIVNRVAKSSQFLVRWYYGQYVTTSYEQYVNNT